MRNDRGLVHNHNKLPVRGGGVAAYIKSSYNFRILDFSTNTHINETEYIILKVFPINLPADHILVAIVYRRPSGIYATSFFTSIRKIHHTYKHIIITGDLNADLMSPNNQTTAI